MRPRLCPGDSSVAGLPDRQENEPEPPAPAQAIISLSPHPYTIYSSYVEVLVNKKSRRERERDI